MGTVKVDEWRGDFEGLNSLAGRVHPWPEGLVVERGREGGGRAVA